MPSCREWARRSQTPKHSAPQFPLPQRDESVFSPLRNIAAHLRAHAPSEPPGSMVHLKPPPFSVHGHALRLPQCPGQLRKAALLGVRRGSLAGSPRASHDQSLNKPPPHQPKSLREHRRMRVRPREVRPATRQTTTLGWTPCHLVLLPEQPSRLTQAVQRRQHHPKGVVSESLISAARSVRPVRNGESRASNCFPPRALQIRPVPCVSGCGASQHMQHGYQPNHHSRERLRPYFPLSSSAFGRPTIAEHQNRTNGYPVA
mmetsp:Transcript_50721/g.135215  ORF Transcript_50721/g.135215 Transcript_50721/m.135215 type:complete len:259 (+) Transcript_50721:1208-1984(+)